MAGPATLMRAVAVPGTAARGSRVASSTLVRSRPVACACACNPAARCAASPVSRASSSRKRAGEVMPAGSTSRAATALGGVEALRRGLPAAAAAGEPRATLEALAARRGVDAARAGLRALLLLLLVPPARPARFGVRTSTTPVAGEGPCSTAPRVLDIVAPVPRPMSSRWATLRLAVLKASCAHACVACTVRRSSSSVPRLDVGEAVATDTAREAPRLKPPVSMLAAVLPPPHTDAAPGATRGLPPAVTPPTLMPAEDDTPL